MPSSLRIDAESLSSVNGPANEKVSAIQGEHFSLTPLWPFVTLIRGNAPFGKAFGAKSYFHEITSDLKTHQKVMTRCRKLNFYSTFKTRVSKSEYLEQIKNMNHRKAIAKLRPGNHNLRIELNPEDIAFWKDTWKFKYVSTALLKILKMEFISFYIVIVLKI